MFETSGTFPLDCSSGVACVQANWQCSALANSHRALAFERPRGAAPKHKYAPLNLEDRAARRRSLNLRSKSRKKENLECQKRVQHKLPLKAMVW